VDIEISGREIAIHEAGHGVAAFALGLPYHCVSIGQCGPVANPTGHHGFGVDLDELEAPSGAARVERLTMCMLAGKYTQGLWHVRTYGRARDGDELATLATADERQIDRLTHSLAGSGTDPLEVRSALLRRFKDLVASVREPYWYLVERLADGFEDGELHTGEDVYLYLKQAELDRGRSRLLIRA
jgi:hypothetical protein